PTKNNSTMNKRISTKAPPFYYAVLSLLQAADFNKFCRIPQYISSIHTKPAKLGTLIDFQLLIH
uniref:hypothetical protein n=1 Tax=Escherichia coli TaxID=562 RepID=UPI00278BD625